MSPFDFVPHIATFVPALVNSVVFSVIGLVTFLVFFFIVDKLTPGELWKELVERKNTAVAIFFWVPGPRHEPHHRRLPPRIVGPPSGTA